MISRAQLRFNWQRAKQRLDAAKAEELRWRTLMVNEFLPASPVIGTNWSGDGTVKIICKENVTLERDKSVVKNTIANVEQTYQVNLSHVFSWQYQFSEASYRELPDNIKIALAPILTIKAATPTVELAKEKK